jgi:hypothetical protein
MMAKTYVVRNPREIPDGVPVITMPDGKNYFEGDTFAKPRGMTLDRLLLLGIVEEATNG